MADASVIKEFLYRIGYKVDTGSQQQAQASVASTQKSIDGLTQTINSLSTVVNQLVQTFANLSNESIRKGIDQAVVSSENLKNKATEASGAVKNIAGAVSGLSSPAVKEGLAQTSGAAQGITRSFTSAQSTVLGLANVIRRIAGRGRRVIELPQDTYLPPAHPPPAAPPPVRRSEPVARQPAPVAPAAPLQSKLPADTYVPPFVPPALPEGTSLPPQQPFNIKPEVQDALNQTARDVFHMTGVFHRARTAIHRVALSLIGLSHEPERKHEQAAHDIGRRQETLNKRFKDFALYLSESAVSMVSAAREVSEGMTQMGISSNVLGVSTRNLQALKEAFEGAGLSGQMAMQAITGMQSSFWRNPGMESFAAGVANMNSQAFAQLNPVQQLFATLRMMQREWNEGGAGRSIALQQAGMLGIPNLPELLAQRKELEAIYEARQKAQKEFGTTTPHQMHQWYEFYRLTTVFWQDIRQIMIIALEPLRDFADNILPTINADLLKFGKWFQQFSTQHPFASLLLSMLAITMGFRTLTHVARLFFGVIFGRGGAKAAAAGLEGVEGAAGGVTIALRIATIAARLLRLTLIGALITIAADIILHWSKISDYLGKKFKDIAAGFHQSFVEGMKKTIKDMTIIVIDGVKELALQVSSILESIFKGTGLGWLWRPGGDPGKRAPIAPPSQEGVPGAALPLPQETPRRVPRRPQAPQTPSYGGRDSPGISAPPQEGIPADALPIPRARSPRRPQAPHTPGYREQGGGWQEPQSQLPDKGAGAHMAFFRAISQSEGTMKAGHIDYDTTLHVARNQPEPQKPLTQMTLQQVYDYGRKLIHWEAAHGTRIQDSSAMGAFQIVGQTMKGVAHELHLNMQKTKFTPEVQRLMAVRIAQEGGINAKEWQSFGIHRDLMHQAQRGFAAAREAMETHRHGIVVAMNHLSSKISNDNMRRMTSTAHHFHNTSHNVTNHHYINNHSTTDNSKIVHVSQPVTNNFYGGGHDNATDIATKIGTMHKRVSGDLVRTMKPILT